MNVVLRAGGEHFAVANTHARVHFTGPVELDTY